MSKTLTTLIIIVICGIGNAQQFEPLELVQKVFTDKDFAKRTNKYSTGECSLTEWAFWNGNEKRNFKSDL